MISSEVVVMRRSKRLSILEVIESEDEEVVMGPNKDADEVAEDEEVVMGG